MKNKSRILFLSISIALSLLTIGNRILLFNRLHFEDVWVEQFSILMTLYVCMSLLNLIHEKSEFTVIVFKTLILFIFYLQYGIFPQIIIPLLSSIFVEMIIMRNTAKALVWGLMILGVIVGSMFLIGGDDWGANVIPYDTLILYVEYSTVIYIFVFLFKKREKQYQSAVNETERLNASVNQLINANLDFQQYVYFIQQESIEKERNRISREIHDTIGYTLTNINMMMEAAVRLIKTDPDKLFTLLLKTRHQTETGLTDMRKAMRELRTLGTELLKGAGGIQSLANTFRDATGVNVSVEFGNLTWAFPAQLEHVVYRIVQEGMTNAFRHGKATEVRIFFHIDAGTMNISIQDNGSGSSEMIEGIGLKGMKERLDEFSGRLIVNNGSEGFELKAVIPIEEYLNGS